VYLAIQKRNSVTWEPLNISPKYILLSSFGCGKVEVHDGHGRRFYDEFPSCLVSATILYLLTKFNTTTANIHVHKVDFRGGPRVKIHF
jgi:hypothetical protein